MDPNATNPTNGGVEAARPLANFHPDTQSDEFLNYAPLDEETQMKKEQEVNELKKVLHNELLADVIKDPKERLLLIDAIQRLGVAYYFEKEIEANLHNFYTRFDDCYKDDLHYTSLRFRLLRHHGFRESCDVFDKFKEKNGSNFKECLIDDVQGILNLYEASHLRLHGENVLEEALDFTKTHLQSLLVSNEGTPLAEQIAHALKRPIYRSSIRMESKYHFSFYESNASPNESLLRLAKLDFNLLQQLHKKELSDLIRWSRSIDFTGKFPFARSRMVEPYIWSLGVCYEPKYSFARIMQNKVFKLITIIDDIYDAYGFIEELEPFTEAILRWDISYTSQLPDDYMKSIYEIVLDTFQEFEQGLASEGRLYAVDYLREALKATCQAYLIEARWCHKKYVPPYNEYMKNAIVSSSYVLMLMAGYQGLGEIATKEAIQWILQNCKAVKASCIHARLLDDLAGHKFEQKRNHVASAVECYMADFDASEEEAYKGIEHQVEEAWKDLQAEMFMPISVPMPLLALIRNMSKALYDSYGIGEDGFTVTKSMDLIIEKLLIEPAIGI